MRLRQSDLKTWQRCPLQWRFANIDQLPAEQACAPIFGSVVHDAVLHLETAKDLTAAQERFKVHWVNPELLDPTYRIDYFLPGRSWRKYMDDGLKILRDWWGIVQWDPDVVLAREHTFVVPLGDHELTGTIDKVSIRYLPKTDERVVLVSDYKTNTRMPTYNYLAEDLQFSAYLYATTRPEFWTGIHDGEQYLQQVQGLRRKGEWVQLKGPQRRDAGFREQRHYERLRYAVNAMASSIDLRLFVPNISGESCKFCPFRSPCGLPEVMEAAA